MDAKNSLFVDVEGGEEEEVGAQPQTYAAVAQGVQGGGTGQHQPRPSGEPSGPTIVSVKGGRGIRGEKGPIYGQEYLEEEEEERTALAAKIRTRTRGSPSPRRTGDSPTPTDEGRGETPSAASSDVVDDLDEPALVVDSEGDHDSDASVKSHVSRSGATKRSKSVGRGRDVKQKRPLDTSSGEEEDPLHTKKDARGRKATTGRGVQIKARKEVAQALKKSREDLRNVERALQGEYDPRKYEGAERRRKIRELEEQVPQLPTRDLVAKVLDFSSKIDEAAKVSKNLKGTLAGLIRDGALYTRIAVDTLSTRVRGEASEREELLRDELAALKAQLADLQREREEERDRRAMPPPGLLQTRRNTTPSGEVVREEEMPEVVADGLPMESPPPGETAAAPPAEKRTWEVVTPNNADASRASTSGARRSRAGKRERSLSRKRANPKTPAKDSSLPSPHAPRKQAGKPLPGKAGEITGEMVERRIQEVFGQSQEETNQRLQRMEDLIRSLVGGGARDSGPAAGPSDPRKGGGGAVRDRPVLGAGQRGGSKGAKEPPERTANAVEGGSKKKRKKRKKAPLSQQTQGVEETGVSLGRDAKSSRPAAGAVIYAAVVGRRSKAAGKPVKGVPKAAAPRAPAKGQAGGPPKKAPKRRLPHASAVVVTRPSGDYREAMARLRREIKLEDLGIGGPINIRSGATGAKIIEVSGEGHAEKADILAGHITRVFLGEGGTRVDRPRRMAEVRLRDMQCGALQPAAGGKHSLWMRLPLTAARGMSLKGRIRVGWGTARVDLLEARPIRCHRCLERGHVRPTCSSEDRSGRCYRCGETGHTSRDCRSAPKCPLCADKGRPATHLLGAKSCAQKNVRGRPPERRILEQAPASGDPLPPADVRPVEEGAREGKATTEAMEEETPSDGGIMRLSNASPSPCPNMRGFGLLQANVNHSPHAQDLLQQSMMERGFTLAIVSEPHRAPENSP
ncbi:PREDICTED: serine/arginine repetitive matrix protein 1-like [Vollenhovia emeryi]|uniref:serine/arginine repetitive matrix protein 1-like n=1 Tax=Vollenhovia emeryi TaxID=411798 RepID=UPI0005F3D6E0|nr:PREDICTED: serine/arginine repetitive matrix protein 1-like [Vollenhovia emeryi]